MSYTDSSWFTIIHLGPFKLNRTEINYLPVLALTTLSEHFYGHMIKHLSSVTIIFLLLFYRWLEISLHVPASWCLTEVCKLQHGLLYSIPAKEHLAVLFPGWKLCWNMSRLTWCPPNELNSTPRISSQWKFFLEIGGRNKVGKSWW